MELEFRRRDYGATHKSQFLPRSQTQKHPLSSTLASRDQQAKTVRGRDLHFFDPLRGLDVNASAEENVEDTCISIEAVTQDLIKEWKSLKRILMQRFPVSKVISFSPPGLLFHELVDAYHNSFCFALLNQQLSPLLLFPIRRKLAANKLLWKSRPK
uniref:Uncharacterized protein At1g50730/F4M15_4 n=1 Tax=Arabidopsis thaliana TaxID=3702 RepID=Q8GWN5_ARATH|nr:unknown protein [Arabidopsis thaliana]